MGKDTAIILFAHGSPVPEANAQVYSLAADVAHRSGCKVSCAFLEVAEPSLATAVAESVRAGARRIAVIPYFLTVGVHVREDLPRLIEQQRTRFPGVEILVGQSLEGYPGMADVILDRVRELLPQLKTEQSGERPQIPG